MVGGVYHRGEQGGKGGPKTPLQEEFAMKTGCKGLILGIAILTVSCSTVSTQNKYDPKADFALFKTYDWLPLRVVQGDVIESNVQVFKNAVDARLAAKGLRMTSENPDMLIATYVGKKEKSVTTHTRDTLGFYSGPEATDYEEGKLIVDFIDAKSKRVVYESVAKSVLDPETPPDKMRTLLDEAAEKMLKDFPPSR
jgi:hypothetical protein